MLIIFFHDMDEAEFSPSIILYNYEQVGENNFKAKRLSVRIDDLMEYSHRDDFLAQMSLW